MSGRGAGLAAHTKNRILIEQGGELSFNSIDSSGAIKCTLLIKKKGLNDKHVTFLLVVLKSEDKSGFPGKKNLLC